MFRLVAYPEVVPATFSTSAKSPVHVSREPVLETCIGLFSPSEIWNRWRQVNTSRPIRTGWLGPRTTDSACKTFLNRTAAEAAVRVILVWGVQLDARVRQSADQNGACPNARPPSDT
jgi:hypothetical protein